MFYTSEYEFIIVEFNKDINRRFVYKIDSDTGEVIGNTRVLEEAENDSDLVFSDCDNTNRFMKCFSSIVDHDTNPFTDPFRDCRYTDGKLRRYNRKHPDKPVVTNQFRVNTGTKKNPVWITVTMTNDEAKKKWGKNWIRYLIE